MRILMLNYEYPPLGGGASPFTGELSRRLADAGVKIDLITMHFKGLKRYEEMGSLRIFRVDAGRKKKETSTTKEMLAYNINAYRKIRTLKGKYNLCHAHFIIPTGAVAYMLRKQQPYILSSHGSDVPGYNPDRFKLTHKFISPFWNKIAKKADLIITPSDSHRMRIESKGLGNAITIPYGIELDFSVSKKEKIVFFAARLFERKGAQYLIKASDALPKDWKLVIAGDGYYRGELQTLAEQARANIEFVGWLSKEQMISWYKRSSIFCLPSDEETFGLVLAEAMMRKNAVITTKGTACEEVVGDAGILVEKRDVEAIREALRTLTSDPKLLKSYQEKAAEKVKEYAWDNILEQYLEIYRRYK